MALPSPEHIVFATLEALGIAFAGFLVLYLVFLALAAIPFVQRHILYSNRINTLWWRDINKPERFGFARGQVTPFFLKTPDDQSIYTWHILPLPRYVQHEEKLSAQPTGVVAGDILATESFRLLKEDPEARVVIYLHGNAGDLAQSHRPRSYHSLTDTSSYHVFSIDYRGFGHSSGIPSEKGLIQDAVALIQFVIDDAGVSPDRIVLLGQSLGTAVASGVAEYFAGEDIEFAGIVLVAGFSNLPKMLSGYCIGGLIPILAPLRPFPSLQRVMERVIWDKWPSAERLERLVRSTKTRLRLSLIAAKDDWDIPCRESDKLFQAAARAAVQNGLDDDDVFDEWKETRTVRKGDDAFTTTFVGEPNIVIRQELFPHGGHNDIMGYAPVALAIMRSFDMGGTGYTRNGQ